MAASRARYRTTPNHVRPISDVDHPWITHKSETAPHPETGKISRPLRDVQTGSATVDLISSIDRSAVTLNTRTSEISA